MKEHDSMFVHHEARNNTAGKADWRLAGLTSLALIVQFGLIGIVSWFA